MDPSQIPANHPLKSLFRTLTDRAFEQSSLRDRDLLVYLTDLLVSFADTEELYRVRDEEGRAVSYLIDLMEIARETTAGERKDYYRYVGDYSLFVLGMYPESLNRPRREIPPSYYVDTGRQGYLAASELEADGDAVIVLRKLADKYERCVLSLNWVREYTHDPFYQYMMRQFGWM